MRVAESAALLRERKFNDALVTSWPQTPSDDNGRDRVSPGLAVSHSRMDTGRAARLEHAMALAQKSARLEQVLQNGQPDHASEALGGKGQRPIQVTVPYVQASCLRHGLCVPLDAVVAIRVDASRTERLAV